MHEAIMSLIKFTESKLSNTGKSGILKPGLDGYYEHVIGGLNTLNSAGEYYVHEGAKHLFESSSVFMRRIKSGVLKGELGHPRKTPSMTNNDFVRRIMDIEETNICVHFADIYLDTEYGKKNPQFKNPSLVAIIAKLKPSGPKASALQASLDNPKENTCFSIRALTKDTYINGRTYRTLVSIVTYDHVNEPGISISNKWDSPAMETIAESPVTIKQLEDIANETGTDIAIESTRGIALESLKMVQILTRPQTIPSYAKW